MKRSNEVEEETLKNLINFIFETKGQEIAEKTLYELGKANSMKLKEMQQNQQHTEEQ